MTSFAPVSRPAPKLGLLITSIDVFNPEAKDASEEALRKHYDQWLSKGQIDAGSLIRGRLAAIQDVRRAADDFAAARVDLVVVANIGFPPGHVFVTLAANPYLARIPLAVVADPEPGNSSEWATNAWCGAIMNNFAARQMNRPITAIAGPLRGTNFVEEISRLLKVAGTLKFLRHDWLVRFGDAPPGFHSATGNQLAYAATFGTQVETVDLTAVVNVLNSGKAKGCLGEVAFGDKDIKATTQTLVKGRKILVEPAMLERGVRLYHAFRAMVRANGFTSGAFRCWPESNEPFIGVSSCMAMGLLLSNGDLASAACEGDWPIAVVQTIGTILSGKPAICLDWVNHTGLSSTVQLGHCGMGVCGLMCGKGRTKEAIGVHPVLRQGGVTMGPVHLGQFEYGPKTGICMTQTPEGRFKMLVFSGESSPKTDKGLAYSAADVHVPEFERLHQLIMEHGFPHHLAMAFGNVAPELRTLCHYLGVEYVSPQT